MHNTRHVIITIVAALGIVGIATTSMIYQEANAAQTTKYSFFVALTDVPANAEDLIMNVTIIRMPFFVQVSETQIKTFTSPSEGDTLSFTFRVPAGSNETNVFVCGTQASDPDINRCDLHPLPSKKATINYAYPT